MPASEFAGAMPLREGPILRLARVDDLERCRFETTFTIPDVEPSLYRITVFSWFADPNDGYGFHGSHDFTVTEG